MGAEMAKRVLILGGGFGGIYAAMELDRVLAPDRDVKITLVNRENFFLFTPMMHEVAAGDMHITNIVAPIRQLLKRVDFLQGDVENIDLQAKQVTVLHCSGRERDVLHYDYLLMALGSTTNFFNLPGVEENVVTMKSLSDAINLRNLLIGSLEEAEFDAAIGHQKPLLTYVVAGAGFAGVETIAALNDFVRDALKFYPHLSEDMVRVVLVDLIPNVLPELGEELGQYAGKKLSERNVELKLNTKIVGYSERGLEFDGGDFIRAVLVVWTAGVRAHPLVKELTCKIEKGKAVVNEFLEVENADNAWALGDCAMAIDPQTRKPYPPTAQHATRMAKTAAHNIAAAVRGRSEKLPFRYKSVGSLAAIGRRTGVAKIMGMKFSGLLAWFLWRSIYLMKLPKLDRKIRVALDWALDLIFPKDFVQFMSTPTPLKQNPIPTVSHAEK
jgi:NADH:ubiquinone reductase (H+-translocating)